MKIASPKPLFPTFYELDEISLTDYPQLKQYLTKAPAWRISHWELGKEFLCYIGRNKSEHTYVRFRNDIEKFLLWSFDVKKQPIDEYRKADILEYIDFCVKPPMKWISYENRDRFIPNDGYLKVNELWRPFKLKTSKAAPDNKPDLNKYRPSQQTLTSTFVGLSSFYNHLMEQEVCLGNPVRLAKKDCKHLVKDSQVTSVKRLTEEQWLFVIDSATEMAEENPIFERNLFIIATMKTLFLRVSELSVRDNWTPSMSHFWEDENNYWWLKVFGKGRKIRDVTVPEGFIHYLKRYRAWRGLSPLPFSGEQAVLVEKIRGQGGLTSRHITRLVQEVFDYAYEKMSKAKGPDPAMKLREASTHYLRHTGASMDIENDRPLKDLSEDLGHASSAITDTVYVQIEKKRRAQSGNKRKVD